MLYQEAFFQWSVKIILISRRHTRFLVDIPFFWNIPDFWNSKYAMFDFVKFLSCLFNVLEKSEVMFPFFPK